MYPIFSEVQSQVPLPSTFVHFQVQPKTGKTRLVFVRKTHGKPAAIGRQLANFTLHAQT